MPPSEEFIRSVIDESDKEFKTQKDIRKGSIRVEIETPFKLLKAIDDGYGNIVGNRISGTVDYDERVIIVSLVDKVDNQPVTVFFKEPNSIEDPFITEMRL